MPLTSFAELTKQVHLLNDIILEDMIYAKDEHDQDLLVFSKHLHAIKNWFTRISAYNKKRFLLALLEDMTSAWAVANVLVCIWNCRTKDAVMSVCEANIWSSYDQVPMDHNRTAMPVRSLMKVMKADRKWFLSLESETQSVVTCELLAVSGGPIMMAILQRAQVIYERYRRDQLINIERSMMVNNLPQESLNISSAAQKVEEKMKTRNTKPAGNGGATSTTTQLSFAQKNLSEHLAQWESTINSMKDSLNLKESEVTFQDGTKRNIWKVKRIKPEDIETVDIIQLLPSSIGKWILSYLPRAQLADCARVNKYWAYLVDEFKAELTTRAKINADMERLQELMLRNDISMDDFEAMDHKGLAPRIQANSLCPSLKMKSPLPFSIMTSIKSAGAHSFAHFLSDKVNAPKVATKQTPIRNIAQMKERLDCRGATDENVFGWCANILKRRRRYLKNKVHTLEAKKSEGGVMRLGYEHFACPLMAQTLKLPLYPPLVADHTSRTKLKRNASNTMDMSLSKDQTHKRFSAPAVLWTRNMSHLYLAFKIPNYCKTAK